MYHLRKLKSLLLLLFVAVTAKAQLSDGKVYNFVNVGNSDKSMTSATAGNYLSIATTDESDYSQLWYCASDGNGFTLRNLGNGNYLRSPNAGGNTNWTLVKTVDGDNCRFNCTQESEHDVLRAINTTDSYHYMHYGATTGTVVCWTSSAPATQWDFTEVSGITAEQLAANWDAIAAINPNDDVIATYRTALDELFADEACTTLEETYASMDETTLKNQAAYNNLPTTLQDMVLKVRNDSWGEDNIGDKPAWDADYAKKYRVQLYEPYNEPEAAAEALGLNAHTNLNNPTGIFSGGREAMYVMVEGEIEEGASLYLASYSGHGKLGGYSNGVELKQGLNVVPSYFAGNNYCINYVVHTFNTEGGTKKGNKAKARKLSDYEDLKIHIEGGHINGYWNKMGDELYTPDTNASWDYIAARATQTDVTVLGEYITLQFPLHDALNSDGGTEHGLDYYYTGKDIIKSSIQEWDNVMMWERIVLGVLDKTTTEDAAKNPKSPYAVAPNVFAYIGDDTDGFESGYDDYYNVHGLSFGTPHGYMYGGWDHCGYHFNTMGAIMTSMITDAGSHWGPAHEIGHQHQGLLTVNGLTEVTNNLFSNVVLWYFGKTTSRVNGSALEPIAEMFANEEADFFNTTSNVFITTQMYYKLFLYYHVLGHNPKFYPKLFEMLRQDPMSGGYNQRGATSILHFYKKCCEAAGEDLTEFFRAYGFFRVMTNRLVGDYANSVYDQTQEDIDNAIAEVKAMAEENGWKQNIAVLFINDDTGGQILSHRSDTEYLKPFESADSELGSYATFNEATTPNYTYTIVGTTVTMEGEGGIGFAIFNEKGELIGFSDNKTFEVSVECAEAIASGKAVVKTVQGDNEAVEAVNIMDTDDTDAKRAMLGELVESAKAVLDLSDEDGTKVGFYRASSLEALESAYTQAEQVYEARTVASYSAVYNALFHEYFEVMNDAYARIGLVEGNAYRLTNKNYPDRSLSIPTDSVNKQMMGEITDTESPYDQQLWYFEASETEGSYYLKNKNTSTYPGNVGTSTFIYATATSTSDAHAYKLRDMGNGLWALEGNTALHLGAANYKYGVLGWGADATASQWYITAVDVNENAEALFSLQGMIEKTKDLAGEMANVQYSGKLALQAVSESEPYYLSTNACHNTLNNASDGQGLAGLLDDDTDTYFHSEYNGKISTTHYLQVDLGSGTTMSKFAFNYATRSNGNNCPTEIVVSGSNDPNGTFNILQTYTAANNGLPNGNALSWESPVIENTGNYRYLRFSVTATENSKKFFVMSTFGITNHETVVKAIEEKYSTAGLTEQTLKNLGEELFDANELMASDAATSAELQTMCSSIEKDYYTPLLEIYNDANAARLTALKEELDALIGKTTDLIGECGTVNYTPGKFYDKAPLQTTSSEGDFYVWTNAQSTQEVKDYEPQRGYLVNLFDGNNETYFHSDYSGANSTDGNDHHITIKLGENNITSKFKFKYITRHDAETNYPKTIKIQGSVDGTNFYDIETITGLPTGNTKTYESGYIEANEYYSHLRFMVTANNNNNLKGGHPIFHMAEFELAIEGLPESYTAELKPEAGDAGTDLLIETFKKNAEAQGVYDYATTELQVEAAIAKLQAQYDILKTAKNAVRYVDFTISSNIAGGGVRYQDVDYTTTLSAPSTLEANELKAKDVDGYVVKSITISDTEISIIYNKVYTVQVEGLANGGGVVYEETTTENGKTFDAPIDLTVENLSPVIVDGYAAGVITLEGSTVTVTYKKIYTVNVSGVTDQGGVMLGGTSYTDEVHVLGTLEANQLSAVEVNGYKAFISVEGTTINVVYKMIYRVEVVGADGGGVTFEDVDYANNAEVYALSAIELSQLTAVEVSGYVGTVTLDDRTIRVAYCKLIQDLTELRNYKAYHIRAKSGEGYFAWNSSITDEYVSLRGVTNSSHQGLPSDENVAAKYTEAVNLSDKTVVWQIIKEGDSYYLYQPEKEAYVTRSGRDYKFVADKTALDGIRQNSEDNYLGTFGIHAGGGYSDDSQDYACICTGVNPEAVRDWEWDDHGAVLQIIENPYVYALDYAVTVVGNANGGVEFEDESYADGETLSATELLTASDLTVKSIDGYEHEIEVNKDNATITITYTAIDKTELINLIASTEALVNSASSHLGSSLNVTQALIDATNERLTTACSVCDDSSVNREEYDATLAELQEAYARLNIAIAYANLPVQLTFDANSPVTYKIKIARANTPVLAYDASSAMVAVTTYELDNKSHAWYFMATTDGKVLIMPYHDRNTTLALSTNEFTEDNSKVKGMPIGEEGYTQEWTITNANMNEANRNDGWYNITTINPSNINTTWYFSNHGGTGNKMGFYNDANDDGSRFQFEKVDFSKSDAYYTLSNYYHNEAKVSGTVTGGTVVGCYPEAAADAYNTAYSDAANVLEDATATDEEYTNAYNALKDANEALNLIMPEVGKYYTIVSACNDENRKGQLMYATGENAMHFANDKKSSDDSDDSWIRPEALWTFTAEGYMMNLQTGCYVSTSGWGAQLTLVENDAKVVSIEPLATLNGQVLLKPGGGYPLHAQVSGSKIVGYSNENNASAWYIVEVKDMAQVKHPVSITQYEHAGLYLNYPVTIPDDVKAYYLDGSKILIDDEGVGTLKLTLIDGKILPARTAVILYAPHGETTVAYDFVYTEEQTDEYENLFTGSTYQTYRKAEENHRYYVFGQNNGEVGLYKNGVKYDATGAEGTTHYKMSANKILFDWNNSEPGQQANSFRFLIGEQTTTDIDDELMDAEVVIYDLYGRRILEVTTSGIYLINGEKHYIRVK